MANLSSVYFWLCLISGSMVIKGQTLTQISAESDLTSQLQDIGEELVVLYFSAPWCGPCKKMAPKVDKLVKEFSDVVFLKVSVRDLPDVAMDYDVSKVPAFRFVKNEKVVAQIGGDYQKLKKLIKKHSH